MNENFPLVSVIVPSYNHGKYIKECIESVISQTYPNIQLIVIDDGSSDSSCQIIEELGSKKNFFFERQSNIGLSKTLNKAINRYCTGKYVCVLASDDYWHPEKVSKQVKLLEEYPDYGFVFAKAYSVNDLGEICGSLPHQKVEDCSFSTLLKGCYVPALTTMVKRSVLIEIGGFDEDSIIEDWDLWLRISDKYRFAFLDSFVGYYRSHDNNASLNYLKMVDAELRILEKWKVHPDYSEIHKEFLLKKLSIVSVLDKSNAVPLLLKHMDLIFRKSYIQSVYRLLFKYSM